MSEREVRQMLHDQVQQAIQGNLAIATTIGETMAGIGDALVAAFNNLACDSSDPSYWHGFYEGVNVARRLVEGIKVLPHD